MNQAFFLKIKGSEYMPYLIIIINILLIAIGQLFFKKAAIFSNNHLELTFLNKFILNPWFYLAITAFGFATIVYIKILTMMQLSVAYPMITTMAYVLTILGSLYFFGEKINMLNIAGIFIMVIGIIIASLN